MGDGLTYSTPANASKAEPAASASRPIEIAATAEQAIASLSEMRRSISDSAFAGVLRANDYRLSILFEPYGWHGSWVDDSDYLREFSAVAANARLWRDPVAAPGKAARPSAKPDVGGGGKDQAQPATAPGTQPSAPAQQRSNDELADYIDSHPAWDIWTGGSGSIEAFQEMEANLTHNQGEGAFYHSTEFTTWYFHGWRGLAKLDQPTKALQLVATMLITDEGVRNKFYADIQLGSLSGNMGKAATRLDEARRGGKPYEAGDLIENMGVAKALDQAQSTGNYDAVDYDLMAKGRKIDRSNGVETFERFTVDGIELSINEMSDFLRREAEAKTEFPAPSKEFTWFGVDPDAGVHPVRPNWAKNGVPRKALGGIFSMSQQLADGRIVRHEVWHRVDPNGDVEKGQRALQFFSNMEMLPAGLPASDGGGTIPMTGRGVLTGGRNLQFRSAPPPKPATQPTGSKPVPGFGRSAQPAPATSTAPSKPVTGFGRTAPLAPAAPTTDPAPSKPVPGFGRTAPPAPAAPTTDPAPSKPVPGFGRTAPPAPAAPTIDPAPSKPVPGFGRTAPPAPAKPRTGSASSPAGPKGTQAQPAQVSVNPAAKGSTTGTTGGQRAAPPKAMAGDDPKGGSDKGDAPKTGTVKPVTAKPAGTGAVDDAARIRQLKDWQKKGKIDGDVAGLEKRLRSKDPETRDAARAEYDEAAENIAKGGRHDVEDFEAPRKEAKPATQQMSTASKMELENSAELKKLLPSAKDRSLFMKWLEKGHKQGDLGKELKPGDRDVGKHEHLRPGSPELEARVNDWKLER